MVHSSFVYSPNVTIQIKDNNGQDVQNARVGDPLTLRFVMDNENSESNRLLVNLKKRKFIISIFFHISSI